LKQEIIIFNLPENLYNDIVVCVKKEHMTINGFFKSLVSDFLDRSDKPKTGRGNKSVEVEELAKKLLRNKHPETVRLFELAKFCGVSQARAARIVDNLSGNLTDGEYDFLCFTDDDGRIGIFRDDKLEIYP